MKCEYCSDWVFEEDHITGVYCCPKQTEKQEEGQYEGRCD